MQLIKNICKDAIGLLGYKIYRSTRDFVSYNNFQDLVKAYEYRLNLTENIIPPNALRPKMLARLTGTCPAEAYFIVQNLAKTKDLKGCICEFGSASGDTSALIANEIMAQDKIFHLFDSFEGLSAPTEKDLLKDDVYGLGNMKDYAGKMSCPEYMVLSRLKELNFPANRYFIHKGFIEQVLRDDTNMPKEVSFAYVDFDFYEPIKSTLEFLHGVTKPGAIIMVDDYDFFSTGAKTAVDEFLKEKNSKNTVYECVVPDKTHYGCFAILTKRGTAL
jgi:O-methyltransferase